MRKNYIILILLQCGIMLFSLHPLAAQSVTPDAGFGTNGIVRTSINQENSGHAIALQSDGRIVVGGGTNGRFVVVRYNSNGTLDQSFGTNGYTYTDQGGIGHIVAIVLQSDDKIVAVGSAGSNFAIVRYNSNGTLDATFGNGGKVITTFPNAAYCWSVALQNDNKILASGYSGDNMALARYNTNGTLDATFGNGGIVTETDMWIGNAVRVQSDGKIVVVGENDSDVLLYRYNTNGTLDPTFGSGGKVITNAGSTYDSGLGMAIQADGKIVVTGYSGPDIFEADVLLLRYNSNGTLDNTFGTAGKTLISVGEDAAGWSVVVHSSGKILVGGMTYNGEDYDFLLVRCNSNGTPDASFGNGGIAITDIEGDDYGYQAIIQNDGKVLMTGVVEHDFPTSDIAVARYIVSPWVGIPKREEGIVARVYPNPAVGTVYVDVPASLTGTSYVISDLLGRTVDKGIFFNTTTVIETTSLPAGIYEIRTVNNNRPLGRILKN